MSEIDGISRTSRRETHEEDAAPVKTKRSDSDDHAETAEVHAQHVAPSTLDGRMGTADELADYEKEQYIRALFPATSTGGVLANVAALEGASIPEIRGAGKAGDLAETASSRGAVRQVHGEVRR